MSPKQPSSADRVQHVLHVAGPATLDDITELVNAPTILYQLDEIPKAEIKELLKDDRIEGSGSGKDKTYRLVETEE